MHSFILCFILLDSTPHQLNRCVVHARVLRVGVRQPHFVENMRGSLALTHAGDHEVVIPPGGTAVLPTGIMLSIPGGFFGRIHGSLLQSTVYSVDTFNTILRSGDKNEVMVHLINRHPHRKYTVHPGEEIGMMVVEKETFVLCIPLEMTDNDNEAC